MKYKKILVPVDGSAPSLRALETALELAKDSQDTVIHAVRIIPAGDMALWMGDLNDPFGSVTYTHHIDPKAYQEMIDGSVARATEDLEGVIKDHIMGFEDRVFAKVFPSGANHTGIVDYADENGCDMIVMGSRGLGGVRSIMGSVSYGVLHSVDIPVTIVK